jgi:polar amino acid transport system substrate-binding protein
MRGRPPRLGLVIRHFAFAVLAQLCALLFAVALWSPAQARAEPAGVVRYGGDRDFPPFEFLDDSGRPQGFQIELLNAIERISDLRVSVRLDEWQAIEADFRAGKLDAMAMSHTRARGEWAAFVQPHATPAMAIYYRTGGRVPVALADLAGRTVAIPDKEPIRETRAEFFSAEHYRFVTFPSALAALEAVRESRADYAFMPRAYGDRAGQRGQARITLLDASFPAARASISTMFRCTSCSAGIPAAAGQGPLL